MAGVKDQLFALALLFCRIGGCLLFAPGLSSPRVPVQVRLFAALALTPALAPLLQGEVMKALAALPRAEHVYLIFTETLTGSAIGLMARFFLLALQFAATAASNFIGLSGIPGVALEEADTGSPLATLVSSAAVMMIFVMGLHIELLKALIESYQVIVPGAGLPMKALARNLTTAVAETSMLALRLAAPFLVYGVIVNFALGLGNRFAQQLSVYHATTGVVILGGFLLLYVMWMDWMLAFTGAYQAWLVEGGF